DVVLNSTYATNYTTENLTVYFNASDSDGDNVTNVTNWYLNGTSFAILNAPFEGGSTSSFTKNYAGFVNGTVHLEGDYPKYFPNGGHDGRGAYMFDGATTYDDLIRFGNITLIPRMNTTTLTVSAWTYINSTRIGAILRIGYGTDLLLGVFDDRLQWYDSGFYAKTFTTPVPVGVWTHVTVVLENASVARYYINGTLNQSWTDFAVNQSVLGPGSRIEVGGVSGTTAQTLNGSLSEIQVYDRAFTADQVALMFQNGMGMIHFNETSVGDVWQACVTPNDGTEDGLENCSNNLTIVNAVPEVSGVVLNSTYDTNYSNEDLTVYWSVSDSDGDNVTNVTNWYVNGTSIMILNMPFEATGGNESSWAKDYSNLSHHGEVVSAGWNSSGGQDGFGAYEFAASEYINISDDAALALHDNFTISMWTKFSAASQDRALIEKKTGAWDSGTGFSIYWADSPDEYQITTSGGDYGRSTSAAEDTDWHHIVVVVSGTTVTFFRDGVSYTSDSSMTAIPASTADLHIGYREYYDAYFDGAIDDVRIYNRTLSLDQITLLYQNRTDRIDSSETSVGDQWFACVTPNDGTEDGVENCSNTLTVVEVPNDAPLAFNVTLNSTYGTNYTNENLTVYWNVSDADGNNVTNVTNWFLNGTSFAVLNMPFEGTGGNESSWVKDYSNNSNHGSVSGATWKSSGGHDGFGAYEFDGVSNYISLSSGNLTPALITLTAWVNVASLGTYDFVISNHDVAGKSGYAFAVYSDNTVCLWAGDGVTWAQTNACSAALSTTGWHHIAFTSNATTAVVYVDGVESGSDATSATIVDSGKDTW
ncbi:LamG domain-containing protein, partial [Nanoarchaeota archaeon]